MNLKGWPRFFMWYASMFFNVNHNFSAMGMVITIGIFIQGLAIRMHPDLSPVCISKAFQPTTQHLCGVETRMRCDFACIDLKSVGCKCRCWSWVSTQRLRNAATSPNNPEQYIKSNAAGICQSNDPSIDRVWKICYDRAGDHNIECLTDSTEKTIYDWK